MAEALPFVSLGALIIGGIALLVGAFALRKAREAVQLAREAVAVMEAHVRFSKQDHPSLRPPGLLDEQSRQSKEESKREHQEHLGTRQDVGQLGEDKQEATLEWNRQRLMEELEQLLQISLKSQQQDKQQEQQRQQPEQESQHL